MCQSHFVIVIFKLSLIKIEIFLLQPPYTCSGEKNPSKNMQVYRGKCKLGMESKNWISCREKSFTQLTFTEYALCVRPCTWQKGGQNS